MTCNFLLANSQNRLTLGEWVTILYRALTISAVGVTLDDVLK